jgi:hypothetical protein
MLVDASISRADVSKAKPSAARPAIGAHARRPAAVQGGRQAAAAARHTDCKNGAQTSRRRVRGRRRGGGLGAAGAPRREDAPR